MPPTAFEKLLPVWTLILETLSPSLPKPLSGFTKEEAIGEQPELLARLPSAGAPGTTARKDIRATELAMLMRTSIAFNQLASRHLYRLIITDRLPDLLWTLDTPRAHPQIQSKRELLRHTRSLHIEYSDKGVEPTYTQVFEDGDHFSVYGCLDAGLRALKQAIIELRQIYLPLTLGCTRNPFPNVTVATFCSIFGAQVDTWARMEAIQNHKDGGGLQIHPFPTPYPLETCKRALELALRTSPITHFCQRGTFGPLSLAPNFILSGHLLSPSPTVPSPFTIHIDMRERHMPMAVGNPTRWVLERYQRVRSMSALFYESCGFGGPLINLLKDLRPNQSSDLEIFCSSNLVDMPCHPALPDRERQTIGPAEERRWCETMGESTAAACRGAGIEPSSFELRWKASIDSPPCLACGWTWEGAE